MLRVNDILFPTDFSECAEHVYALASELARKYRATLHVLYVEVPDAVDQDDPMSYLVEDEGPSLQASYPEEGFAVTYAKEQSLSEETGILEYAEDEDIDLIVMGTHGREGLQRAILGSVAEGVVRRAPCPVLTVRPQTGPETTASIRRILVPVDFSEYGGPALAYARDLAVTLDASLDVVHVIEEADLVAGNFPSRTGVASTVLENSLEALQRQTEQELGPDVPFEAHVTTGDAADRIVEVADERGVDLIVMATHGRTGLRRLFAGSVAEAVVRRAPCPVFVVKSFGKSLLSEADEAPPSNENTPSSRS